jgi:hypothetical protein
MAQQTAVEWLIKIYQQTGKIDNFDLEVANEMFKEQMKDAVLYGLDEDGHTGDWKISVAENYYIKTYTK